MEDKTMPTIQEMLAEDARRMAAMDDGFNPVTGEGSTGQRFCLRLDDWVMKQQWLPVSMRKVPLVRSLMHTHSVEATAGEGSEVRRIFDDLWVRLRCRHDFAYWCAMFVTIKQKGGTPGPFILNYPQRKLVEALEDMRLQGLPIRLIVLKARQWGGSTCTQMYMAWLQLCHREGLNSLIVAHVNKAGYKIKDMYDRMLLDYPLEMLHKTGDKFEPNEAKMTRLGNSDSDFRVPQRQCTITIGTAESPDNTRAGDYSLVHMSEVGLWKTTEGKRPEEIIAAATSGILLQPYTMIVYESTAKGTGNFFQREYAQAKKGGSQFRPLFVAWYEIAQYRVPVADKKGLCSELTEGRNSDDLPSDRAVTGKYLWWLWQRGACLEAIAWYKAERAKYNDQAYMASEYPSDDIEAFVSSSDRVFDMYRVEPLRATCRTPLYCGDITGQTDTGDDCIKGLRFMADRNGTLQIWSMPDEAQRRGDKDIWDYIPHKSGDTYLADRYLTVVDIGGRSQKADWSVIVVFDRMYCLDGQGPAVVAQWRGHIDMDRLAWKAMQIAAFYDEALLVIESNTLETHDRDRRVDGDQSTYILQQIRGVYRNLYARRQSAEDIRQGLPRKWGFHTNVATKPLIISTLVKVVREGLYTERDAECLDEMLVYERKPNGAFGAIEGRHDDLLMTRAIGLHISAHEMPLPVEVTVTEYKPSRFSKAASVLGL